MFTYGELLKEAKASNTYTKEEWFKIFQILIKWNNEQQFYADWDYI